MCACVCGGVGGACMNAWVHVGGCGYACMHGYYMQWNLTIMTSYWTRQIFLSCELALIVMMNCIE